MLMIITLFGSNTTLKDAATHGAAAFLTKPIFPNILQAAFTILWDAKQKGIDAPTVTRASIAQITQGGVEKLESLASFPGTRALVVEDMRINQLLMMKILERLGCQVDSSVNGKDAVAMAQHADYDIIFMDCQMPVMDGFEATHKIREEEGRHHRHTPIVALTADAMIGDREKCLKEGMDDYLNKPFTPEQIVQLLQKWCAPHEGRPTTH